MKEQEIADRMLPEIIRLGHSKRYIRSMVKANRIAVKIRRVLLEHFGMDRDKFTSYTVTKRGRKILYSEALWDDIGLYFYYDMDDSTLVINRIKRNENTN